MRGRSVQPAMGSREPLGAARLRAAARSVARQLSRFLGKRLVQRPRVLAGDGGRDALGVVGQERDVLGGLAVLGVVHAGARHPLVAENGVDGGRAEAAAERLVYDDLDLVSLVDEAIVIKSVVLFDEAAAGLVVKGRVGGAAALRAAEVVVADLFEPKARSWPVDMAQPPCFWVPRPCLRVFLSELRNFISLILCLPPAPAPTSTMSET